MSEKIVKGKKGFQETGGVKNPIVVRINQDEQKYLEVIRKIREVQGIDFLVVQDSWENVIRTKKSFVVCVRQAYQKDIFPKFENIDEFIEYLDDQYIIPQEQLKEL